MKAKLTAIVSIIIETRYAKKDGTYPLKLRVTSGRERKYYVLKDAEGKSLSYSEKEFTAIMKGERPRSDAKEMRIYLNDIEKRACDVIKALPVFTFESFERKFYGAAEDEQDLLSCLRNKALNLKAEGRISTAMTYDCALTSLEKFSNVKKIAFKQIDVPFLKEYENWMISNKKSLTTIGMYLRNVRAMYNDAMSKGIIQVELYPFGRGKYQIPNGINVKKALTHQQISLIAAFPVVEGTNEHRYRDYWLFSFLCNGINIKDVAQLRYKDIDEDIISFVRAKTKRETKHRQRKITIIITQLIGKIIDRWGNTPRNKENYIFPILHEGLSPRQEYNRIADTVYLINKYIRRVAKEVGITQNVSTYSARHSFATVLKRSGASTEFISESLGHSNIATTESYLASFEKDEQRKWAEKVSNLLTP